MWRRLKSCLAESQVPVTHAGVLGQVWRGGPRQARLSQALGAIDVLPLDVGLARRAGELLGASRQRDLIDAALVLVAQDGDDILTDDPQDLSSLAAAARLHVELLRP